MVLVCFLGDLGQDLRLSLSLSFFVSFVFSRLATSPAVWNLHKRAGPAVLFR